MKGKGILFSIAYLMLILLAVVSTASPVPSAKETKDRPYKKLKFPKLPELKIPEPARFVLPNGMVVYLLEDHELPIVSMKALIRTGARWEPADKIGLAGITGSVMRTGGTTSKTGDQMDEELESIGASVESSIGTSYGSASASALKEHSDTVLAAFADMLMNPAFREDKIELAKIRAKDAIARRNDDVTAIARREFAKLIYRADSPYARQTEYKTIDNIQRDDLVAFHRKYYAPNNVILGAWGDFSAANMKVKIENAFKDWKSSQVSLPALPEVKEDFRKGVYFIKKEDVTQANLRMGHIGGKLNDTDYHALAVLGEILGGGFSSRLFKNVRSDQGLAYAVFGAWGANYDYPGIFFVGGETKSESTVRAIKAFMQEVEKITQSEVTDEELQVAKDSILNSFIFNFDTKAEVVERILTYEYYGYPKDFLMRYKDNVEKVTKGDILRVAKLHIHPDKMILLAVGNEKQFDQSLATLGPVQTIDITIPVEAAAVPVASSANVAKGKGLLSAALSAMGGDKLVNIRDMIQVAKATINSPQGEVSIDSETIIVYPDKLRQRLQLPVGEILMTFDGANGWMKTPMGTQNLPDSQKGELLKSIFADTISLFKNMNRSDVTVQFVEEAQVDGKKANVILVSGKNGESVKLFIDPVNNLPMKKVYKKAIMGPPADVEDLLSDYREVSGVRLPFKITTIRDGKKMAEAIISDVKINAGVDPKLFAKE